MDKYLDQLKVIRKIKFTAHEIEILVCIVNNRSHKKIAYILDISYRGSLQEGTVFLAMGL
jgi:DNA-binding CsgD family transcriptional regulator